MKSPVFSHLVSPCCRIKQVVKRQAVSYVTGYAYKGFCVITNVFSPWGHCLGPGLIAVNALYAILFLFGWLRWLKATHLASPTIVKASCTSACKLFKILVAFRTCDRCRLVWDTSHTCIRFAVPSWRAHKYWNSWGKCSRHLLHCCARFVNNLCSACDASD